MRLCDVLTGFFWLCLSGRIDIDIKGISDDSRTIQRGDVFVCIHGARTDGFDKIGEAIDKGAAAIVADRPCSYSHITCIQTPDTRLAVAKMAAAFYGFPSKKMTMIGITGTKGKTTTAYMLREIFLQAGHRVGIIGTVETDDGKKSFPSLNTTPGALRLQRDLARMAGNGVDTVIMEVSSQGLKQSRTAGIMFDAAVLTNIYPDHIGKNEHTDMAEYVFCKSLIFHQCRLGIVNENDSRAMDAVKNVQCRLRYFGAPAENITYRTLAGETLVVETCMPGGFNRMNALAAAVTADYLGIGKDAVRKGLMHVKVRGRTEIVKGPWDFTVMIDYAHNAAALESLLMNLKKECRGRLVCMFGCGGNRARSRRAQMGEVSGRLADLTVVTTDNPRNEDPAAIISDIVAGLRMAAGSYVVVPKREDAIRYCVKHAKKDDMVVLAGKGHEMYQEIHDVKYPFDEREILQRAAGGR